VRVTYLTTSYPRSDADVAGAFVRDAVEHVRRKGIETRVVSPASFRHFGLAYGAGIAGNVRARPARAALVPAFLAAYARAARRGAEGADLVHAHWLPSGYAALATGRPFVVTAWGSDVELAVRVPALFRPVLERARRVIAPSQALADALHGLGAEDVAVVPAGVEIPDEVGAAVEPPHVLYVGRLSPEMGVEELAAATGDLPRVVVGDGPLLGLLPDAVGFVPPRKLGPYYARAAVVVCPSRREGYGVVAREAMAHGRPVVAAAVGGLLDVVEDGVTGLLVPPGDASELRTALERLLTDPDLRQRLGRAARERVRVCCSWEAATDATLAVYGEALAGHVPVRR
jgi:glycosyltransferase involved in cell wall biosynthesis